jgi:hypothetical protein
VRCGALFKISEKCYDYSSPLRKEFRQRLSKGHREKFSGQRPIWQVGVTGTSVTVVNNLHFPNSGDNDRAVRALTLGTEVTARKKSGRFFTSAHSRTCSTKPSLHCLALPRLAMPSLRCQALPSRSGTFHA